MISDPPKLNFVGHSKLDLNSPILSNSFAAPRIDGCKFRFSMVKKTLWFPYFLQIHQEFWSFFMANPAITVASPSTFRKALGCPSGCPYCSQAPGIGGVGEATRGKSDLGGGVNSSTVLYISWSLSLLLLLLAAVVAVAVAVAVAVVGVGVVVVVVVVVVVELPIVSHKAVAEVSKIGNLQESLVVVNPGWQSEATDGPKGAWSLSLFLSLSLTIYLPTYLFSVYLSIYRSF